MCTLWMGETTPLTCRSRCIVIQTERILVSVGRFHFVTHFQDERCFFQVEKSWSIKNGLLFEKAARFEERDPIKTPRK